MKKRINWKVIWLGSMFVAMLVLAAIDRGLILWEASVRNTVDAQNAVDEHIVLRRAIMEWDRRSGAGESWISASERVIQDLEQEFAKFPAEISELRSMSFWQKAFFPNERAKEIETTALWRHDDRKASLAALLDLLKQSQRAEVIP